MSTEENARVVRRWVDEVMSQGRLDVIDEVVAENLRPARARGNLPPDVDIRRRVRAYITAYRSAFPDLQVTVDDLVACGDTVTLCWTNQGTHTGHFSFPEARAFGLAPTGRTARWSGITLFRLKDGKIVETRAHGDVYGLLRQLRLLPPPGPVESGS
jgi:predicted ester cyclase